MDIPALMEELRRSNPADALDAIAAPAPLTLGRIAVLERAGCAILASETDNLSETLAALWLIEIPIEDAASLWPRRYELSAVWADKIKLSQREYRRRLYSALGAIDAFRRMCPRPTEEQKKTQGSETDG